ncbi:hypothetical protein M1403_01610 [Patescibacteria group bacterium]|nr:hypothetical protein [Patescibacteria group bacterium]
MIACIFGYRPDFVKGAVWVPRTSPELADGRKLSAFANITNIKQIKNQIIIFRTLIF